MPLALPGLPMELFLDGRIEFVRENVPDDIACKLRLGSVVDDHVFLPVPEKSLQSFILAYRGRAKKKPSGLGRKADQEYFRAS